MKPRIEGNGKAQLQLRYDVPREVQACHSTESTDQGEERHIRRESNIKGQILLVSEDALSKRHPKLLCDQPHTETDRRVQSLWFITAGVKLV